MSAARDLFASGEVDAKRIAIWTACKDCGKPARVVIPAWARGSYWPALCEQCKQERDELSATDPIRLQIAERGIGAVDWENVA